MTASTLERPGSTNTGRAYDDHADLWTSYLEQRSPEARNALVLRYQPLVGTVVKSLPRNVRAYWDEDDLVSFGTFGLIDAISRWTPTARFETYATTRIRGAIYDELRRLDWLPRRVRRHVVCYNHTSDELVSRLGRMPSETEVLQAAGLGDAREQQEAVEAVLCAQLLHIDHGVVYGAADEVIELPCAAGAEDPETVAVRSVRSRELRDAVKRLPEQQRVVVTLHLLSGLTQLEVAAMLAVSESRVCQIAKAAIRSLRVVLRDEDLSELGA